MSDPSFSPLRRGDPVATNWRAVNALIESLRRAEGKISQQAGQIAELQRRVWGHKKTTQEVTGYPFDVFTLTDAKRTALGTLSVGSHSWRRVFVREGYVNLFRVTGSVTPNPYPDDPAREFNGVTAGANLAAAEIVVPESASITWSLYFIYVRVTFDRIPNPGDPTWWPKGESVVSAEILHSANPITAHGWKSFPAYAFAPGGQDASRGTDIAAAMTEASQPGVVYFLVAAIDSHQAWLDAGAEYDDNSEVNQLDIRPFQRADINCPAPLRRNGGGEDEYEPAATTDPATEITESRAILNATIDGGNLVTTVWFEWGLTTAYGHETGRVEFPNGIRQWESLRQTLPVGLLVDGLEPGLTYHFRVRSENSAGMSDGDDATFTTLPPTRTGRHPFKVYNLSQADRTLWGAPDPTGTGSWRKFFVASGYANLVPAANTDQVLNPDEPFAADNGPILPGAEIVVPENTAAYYVYLEVVVDNLGVTHADVWHSTDPTSDGWTDFALGIPAVTGASMTPDPGTGPASVFYLLAIIDTKTAFDAPGYNDDDESTVAHVRQFQRGDINLSLADALRLREYQVCVDDVTKYAIQPGRPETDAPSL